MHGVKNLPENPMTINDLSIKTVKASRPSLDLSVSSLKQDNSSNNLRNQNIDRDWFYMDRDYT